MRIASAAEISLYLCNRYLAFSRHLKDVSSWRFLGSVKNHYTKKFASTIRSHEFCTSSVAVVARQHIQRNKGSPVVEQSISLATNSRCRRIKGLQVAKLCENLTSCNAAGGCTSEQQVTGKQNWIPSVGSWPIAADSASYSGHSRAQFSDLGLFGGAWTNTRQDTVVRPAIALLRVPPSTYSSSPPTGTPCAIREALSPRRNASSPR